MDRDSLLRDLRQNIAKLKELALKRARLNEEENEIMTAAAKIYASLEDMALLRSREYGRKQRRREILESILKEMDND